MDCDKSSSVRIKFVKFIFFMLFLTILFLTRGYGLYKLPLLLICFVIAFFYGFLDKKIKYDKYVLISFFSVVLGAIVWSTYGLFLGNEPVAIWDTIRLFVFFYLVYFVIAQYLSEYIAYSDLELPICISSILISIVALISIYDINILPVGFRDAIGLRIGIHEGYIQNAAHHIGMLAFIFPYLFSLFIFGSQHRKRLVNISLLMSFIAILLSSRRAIYIVILITPFFVIFLHCLTTDNLKSKSTYRIIRLCIILFVLSSISVYLFYINYTDVFNGFVERGQAAINQFNTNSLHRSIRSIQTESLIRGLSESPVLGSGFGGVTGVARGSEGWLYELSYHTLLFNVGALGFAVFIVITAMLFIRLIYVLKVKSSLNKFNCIAIMSGVFGMYIISYSNPYISSSFDFIFVNFAIPFALLKEIHFEG